MPYTRSWDETVPAPTDPAANIATYIDNTKTDLRERIETMLGLEAGDFSLDPIPPGLQQCPVVDDATDRDTVFPTPRAKQRVYNTETDQEEMYTGTRWIPIHGTTQYNVKRYGAIGDGVADDTTACQAAVADANAVSTVYSFGAKVIFPEGAYSVTAQLAGVQGVVFAGCGMRSSRIISSFAGFAVKCGDNSTLSYGCGVESLSINMTNINGGGIQALATAGFNATNLYIEGYFNGNSTGIFLDGGDQANIFSVLSNVILNHVHKGVRIASSGSSYTTSVNAIGVSALCDVHFSNGATSIGLEVIAPGGQGSTFTGGNFESCGKGISITGNECKFIGTRFEDNTADVSLEVGAVGNVFIACQNFNVLVDSSGSTKNKFLLNMNGSNDNYPPDTIGTLTTLEVTGASILSGPITFGAGGVGGLGQLTQGSTGAILNNGVALIPILGHCFKLIVTDTVSNDSAEYILAPSSGNSQKLVAQTGAGYSDVATTPAKINVYYAGGGNLGIENKLGSTTTVFYVLLRIRN